MKKLFAFILVIVVPILLFGQAGPLYVKSNQGNGTNCAFFEAVNFYDRDTGTGNDGFFFNHSPGLMTMFASGSCSNFIIRNAQLQVRGQSGGPAELQVWNNSTNTTVAAVTTTGDFIGLGGALFGATVQAAAFSGAGPDLTGLNAGALAINTVPTARLGSGTADNTTFLRGDQTWQAISSGTGNALTNFDTRSWTNFGSFVHVNGVLTAQQQAQFILGLFANAPVVVSDNSANVTVFNALTGNYNVLTNGSGIFSNATTLRTVTITNGNFHFTPVGTTSSYWSNNVNGIVTPTNVTALGFTATGLSSLQNVNFLNADMTGGTLTLLNSGHLVWSARSRIVSDADGQILIKNNAQNDFDTLWWFTGFGFSNSVNGAELVNRASIHTNLVLKGLIIPSGANSRVGTATLVNGTVTVNNTTVTANTVVHPSFKTIGGTTAGILNWSVNAGTSFTLTSVGATGTTVTTDQSVVTYELIENP